jgi:ferredoxin
MQPFHRECIRPNLKTIVPDKMRRRPLDARGYPVPWFVAWIAGKPDFRIVDPNKFRLAVDKRRCWLCGGPIGKFATFVLGPMCMVNRISAEPPSHMECAKFAVRGCPFLTIPTAQYRDAVLPADARANPGMLTHNPEVSALWTCSEWQTVAAVDADGSRGTLVEFGDAKTVSYWREGREATPREVRGAFNNGLTKLQNAAAAEGGTAPARLARLVDAALFYLPEVA